MASAAKGSGRTRGLFSFLPVLGVLALIGVVYHTTTFVLLDRWLGLGSQHGTRVAAAFTVVAAMCLISFAFAVLTDPGRVPASFAPEIENPQRDGIQLKHCDKCGTYKPSRAHHCRVCKRCVLKMDHHCLWINNCVGFRNYKPFAIFVLFASIASIFSAVIIVTSADKPMHNHLNHLYHWQAIFICDATNNGRYSTQGATDILFYVFYGLAVIFLSLVLGSLLCWHIYLMSHNMTTIEYRGAVRAIWLARKSGQPYRHPFDLGLWQNFKSILGSNILFWLWPNALGHLKDGMHFPVCHN